MKNFFIQLKDIANSTYFFYYLILLNFFAGILTFFGFPILIPAIDIITNNEISTDNKLVNYILNLFNTFSIDISFISLCIVGFLLIFLGILVNFILQIINAKIHANLTFNYMKKILKLFPKVKWNILLDSKSGDLISAINRECMAASEVHLSLLRLVTATIFFGVYILLSFIISNQITSIAVFVFLILFSFNFYFSKKISFLSNIFHKKFLELSNFISSFSVNKKVLKSSNRYEKFLNIIVENKNQMKKYFLKLNYFEIVAGFIIKILALLFIGFIFINFKFFSITISELLVLMIIFSRLQPQFLILSSEYNRFFERLPYYKTIKSRINNFERNIEISGKKNINTLESIELNKLDFVYENRDFSLKNLNYKFIKNTTNIIFGKSGSGKSTVLDLIIGLQKPISGKIKINGINLDDLNIFKFRELISYISQNVTLIDDTIRENILLFRENCTDNELKKYIEICQLDEFIRTLPKGLDTLIGENGIMVSGGQAQRLALCRSLIQDCPIIILDEVTSNLDNNNKLKVTEIIKNLSGKKTIIVVTHDIDFAMCADNVVIMRDGKFINKYEKPLKKEDILKDIE